MAQTTDTVQSGCTTINKSCLPHPGSTSPHPKGGVSVNLNESFSLPSSHPLPPHSLPNSNHSTPKLHPAAAAEFVELGEQDVSTNFLS